MRASFVLERNGAGKGELEEDGGLAESSPRFAEAALSMPRCSMLRWR